MKPPIKSAGLVVAKPTAANQALFSAWGNQAQNAMGQGWYVAQDPDTDGSVVFRSPYDATFNNVVIPNQKEKGHIALIGHPNKTFDVVIRDAAGNVKSFVHKGVSPDFVQNYITNQNSTVAQRNQAVLAGRNLDKKQIDGTYAALK